MFCCVGTTAHSVRQSLVFALLLVLFLGSGSIFFPNQVQATTHTYVQTLELQTTADLYSRDLAVDGDDSVIVVGEFADTATFADGTPEETTLTSTGNYDIFIAKYLSDGTLSWVVNIGDSGDDRAFSVAVGSNDTIYVAGTFSGTVPFNGDSDNPGDSERTSAGNSDSYLLKFTSNGVYSWVQTWGNAVDDYNYAVAIDTNDDVYVGGSFNGTVDFDPSGDTNNLSGIYSAFFSKFSSSGSYDWTQTWDYSGGSLGIGEPEPITIVQSIAVSNSGAVYVGGYFNGEVDFDPGGSTDTVIPAGDYDAFVVKYSSTGTYGQVFSIGGGDTDYFHDLSVDDTGNLYVVGQFSDKVYFDSLGEIDRSDSFGGRDAFLLSLDSDLVYRWHHTWGGTSHDSASGLVVSNGISPMAYVTGFFNESVIFEPEGTTADSSAGDQDAYAISFTSSGTYDWHTVWGNSGTDQGTAVALTSGGNLFLTGYYASTVDFDFTSDVDNHSASGTSDGFITEYYVPVSSASSSNSSSSSGSSQGPGIPGTPGCSIVPPVGAPDLFQIARTGPQATLYFSPVKNNATSYYISYGNDDATEGYGVSFPYSDTSGVISYTVNALDPAGSYSFKVRAGNGCATGLWSQVIKVGPARTRLADTTSAAPQSLLTGLALLGTSSMFLALLRQTRHD